MSQTPWAVGDTCCHRVEHCLGSSSWRTVHYSGPYWSLSSDSIS